MIASMPHLPSYMTNILAFDARHSHMDIYSNFEFIEQVNFPNITLTSLCGCVLRRQYFFGGAIAEKSCVYIWLRPVRFSHLRATNKPVHIWRIITLLFFDQIYDPLNFIVVGRKEEGKQKQAENICEKSLNMHHLLLLLLLLLLLYMYNAMNQFKLLGWCFHNWRRFAFLFLTFSSSYTSLWARTENIYTLLSLMNGEGIIPNWMQP